MWRIATWDTDDDGDLSEKEYVDTAYSKVGFFRSPSAKDLRTMKGIFAVEVARLDVKWVGLLARRDFGQ